MQFVPEAASQRALPVENAVRTAAAATDLSEKAADNDPPAAVRGSLTCYQKGKLGIARPAEPTGGKSKNVPVER